MFRERIPARQLTAWLFAGTTPVLIQLLSGGSWLWVGIAGVTSVVTTLCIWKTGWEPLKWQCPFLFIYIVVLLSSLLRQSAHSWPAGDPRALPLMLVLLGAWSAQKGPSAAARVGAVLFWAVLILYLAVFGAGVKDVRWDWLKPRWNMPDSLGFAIMLTPCASVCLLKGGKRSSARLVLSAMFVLTGAIITAGVLSPDVAAKTENAFYEMSRSINLLGIARRFEALISAGMTVGWFALISLLLSICGSLAQKFLTGWGRTAIWFGAVTAAVLQLCGLHISGWALTIIGAVFWVAMPILTQGLGKRKKS